MTLSTQTQTPTRPSPARRRRRPGRADLVTAGVGIALAAGIGAVVLTGQSTYGPSDGAYGGADTSPSAYARPLPALGGQTLAAYLADHQSSRLGDTRPTTSPRFA